MADTVMLLFAGIAGTLLGVVFFGGLWWTIRQGLTSDYIALWFFGSFVVRMGVIVTGFILVSAGRWERMVTCLVGFFVARVVLARLTRPTVANQKTSQQPSHTDSLPRITHAS